MSTKISLSGNDAKKINSGEIWQFNLASEMFDEQLSDLITVSIPKYPRRIDFVNVTSEFQVQSVESYQGTEYRISSYKSEAIKGNRTTNKVTIKLNSSPTSIRVNDLMNVTASSGPLASLNNRNYRITSKDQKRPYVSIEVEKSRVGVGSGSVNPSVNSIKEIIKIATGKRYRISLENNYINAFLYNEYAKDIAIFAYSQSSDPITTGTEKKLMNDKTAIGSNPPSYSAVIDAFGNKQAYASFFDNANGNNIEFYVAIARYIKNKDNTWSGTWLQLDDSNNPIWKKASRPV